MNKILTILLVLTASLNTHSIKTPLYQAIGDLEKQATFLDIDPIYSSTDIEFSLFCKSLKANTSLKTLHLDNFELRDHHVEYLAEALKENTTLSSLSLKKFTFVSQKGFDLFADALRHNKALKSLNLSDSLLTFTGIKKLERSFLPPLAEALKVNKTLTHLDLSLTGTDTKDILAIINIIKENPGFKYLDFRFNDLNKASRDEKLSLLQKINSIYPGKKVLL